MLNIWNHADQNYFTVKCIVLAFYIVQEKHSNPLVITVLNRTLRQSLRLHPVYIATRDNAVRLDVPDEFRLPIVLLKRYINDDPIRHGSSKDTRIMDVVPLSALSKQFVHIVLCRANVRSYYCYYYYYCFWRPWPSDIKWRSVGVGTKLL